MTQRPHEDRYVVEGRGPFPVDMLMRDQSRAATAEDQASIDASYENGLLPRERRRVTLVTRSPATLDERWESFGWRIVRPLRPWGSRAGYLGEEPTEDVPEADGRRMLVMHVTCPDNGAAMAVEAAMRQAANRFDGVVVRPSAIEPHADHWDRAING